MREQDKWEYYSTTDNWWRKEGICTEIKKDKKIKVIIREGKKEKGLIWTLVQKEK